MATRKCHQLPILVTQIIYKYVYSRFHYRVIYVLQFCAYVHIDTAQDDSNPIYLVKILASKHPMFCQHWINLGPTSWHWNNTYSMSEHAVYLLWIFIQDYITHVKRYTQFEVENVYKSFKLIKSISSKVNNLCTIFTPWLKRQGLWPLVSLPSISTTIINILYMYMFFWTRMYMISNRNVVNSDIEQTQISPSPFDIHLSLMFYGIRGSSLMNNKYEHLSQQ